MRDKKVSGRKTVKDLDLKVAFQGMVDGIEDEVLVIDDSYRIRFANDAAKKSLQNSTASTLLGQLCYDVLHDKKEPCCAPLWDCPLKKALQSARPVTTIHPNPSASDAYVKITAYPILDKSSDATAIVEMRRDATAERNLEAQILRRHHQLSALGHISSAVSGHAELDTVLKLALDNVLEIVGGTMGGILLLDDKSKTLSYRIQRGLPADYAETRQVHLGEGITGTVAKTGESILLEDISEDPRTASPDIIKAEGIKGFVSIPLKAKDRVVGVMNIFSHAARHFGADDVSLLNSIGDYLGTTIEQAKLYERLARVGERYQALLRHSLTAQEKERKRIASELHDETAQSLTSITLSLQAIIGMAEIKGYNDPDFMEKLRKTHSYAVHAGTEIVRLMKELRPTLLDELGMPAAIHRYAKDTLQAQGINVITNFKGTNQRFPAEVEVTLFRIAQSAIGNILEHSEAKNANINLKCNSKECVLTIEDDGKGFNVNKLTRVERSGRGAGLFTMRERTSQLGGTGYVESTPGKGTKITARVPLVRNVIDEENKSPGS